MIFQIMYQLIFERNKFRFLVLIEHDINKNIVCVNFYFPDYNYVFEKKCKDKDKVQEKEKNKEKANNKKDGFTAIIISLNEGEISKKNNEFSKKFVNQQEKENMNLKAESQILENKIKSKDMIILKIEKRNQEFDGFFF